MGEESGVVGKCRIKDIKFKYKRSKMNIESEIKINSNEPHLEGNMETNDEMWVEMRKEVENVYREKKVSEDLIKQFVIHNEQVENFVKRFSMEEKFNDREMEIAVLAAIFHDVAKGWGDFLKHGEEGGALAEKTLLDMGLSQGLARSVRLAIERHMGQDGYPSKIAKETYGEDFEFPEYETKVGQMVYECDILTQLTGEGFEKILLLRKLDSDNLEEDRRVARKENISIEQARLRSVLESARKSFELITIPSVKQEAEKLWQEIEKEYK